MEVNKASKNSNGRLIREDFPGLIHMTQKGHAAHTFSKKYQLKRMPDEIGNAAQLHPIADLSRRLGNELPCIAARPQM